MTADEEKEALRAILLDDTNYNYPDWAPEVDVEAMTEALVAYVSRVRAYAFNDGYNAATDAHGITK